MQARRVIIVGGSLFAETLAQALAGAVEVVGRAPTPEAALSLIRLREVDAVIVAETGAPSAAAFGRFLAAHPDLPLIRADLSADDVQVITSQRIGAGRADLLAAIAALPKRET